MIITAVGNGATRGAAFGELLRDILPVAWSRWCENFQNNDCDPHELATRLTEAPAWATCEKYLPDFVDELQAMAHAAGVPWSQVAALSMLDEAWALTGGMACTAVAITRGDQRVAGQTMDLQLWTDGLQTILRARDQHDVSVVAATYPGTLATCGVNNHGVVVIVNALDLATDMAGIPVSFFARAALHQPTASGAIDLIRSLPHAAGQTYTILDETDLFMVEADANAVISVPTQPEVSWHTNHSFTREHAISESSRTRWDAVDHMTARLTDADSLMEALNDTSTGVCQVHGRFTPDMYSFMSVVGDSKARRAWVNVSPATHGQFQEVSFA